MTTPDLIQLRDLAQTMRVALNGAIRAALLPADTSGTCALASVLVHDAVQRFTPYASTIRGGSGELQEGARAADGTWHGHYWLEVETPTAGTVVMDITADQFGWPAPLCEPLACLPDRYRPGEQSSVDMHMEATLDWIQRPDHLPAPQISG